MNFSSFLILAAVAATTAPRAADVALLVNEPDAAAIVEPLHAAVASDQPLVRATAARVVNVREVQPLVAAVREQLGRETDVVAGREEARAVASLGTSDDLDAAIAAARKWPSSIDADVALAVASRGGSEALALYPKLRSLRQIDRRAFFRMVLWSNPALLSLAASRVLGAGDDAGWHALLQEARSSRIALDPAVLAAGLASANEAIRGGTVWHLARSYAADPAQMPAMLRERLADPSPAGISDREAFGRELLFRMLGHERKDDPRWTAWLQSIEADAILGSETDPAIYDWLTDDEFAARKQHCGLLPFECTVPQTRTKSARSVAPRPVAPPEFNLPGVLPPGLATEMQTCGDGWLGIATASVSPRAHVASVDIASTKAGRCSRVLEAILRLSLPSPAAMTSAHRSDNVLLVRAQRQPLCLDEAPPSDTTTATVWRVGARSSRQRSSVASSRGFPTARGGPWDRRRFPKSSSSSSASSRAKAASATSGSSARLRIRRSTAPRSWRCRNGRSSRGHSTASRST